MATAEDFDHWEGEHLTDPYPYYKRLRDEDPVGRCDNYGGFVVISRYDDVLRAADDTASFTSTDGPGIPAAPMVGMIPIDIDPPEQRLYRNIINPAFTARAVATHEPRIRELTVGLLDGVADRHEFDAAAELAFQLPQLVTLDFIGFPTHSHTAMVRAIDDLTHLRGAQTERMSEASTEIVETVTEMIESRRAEPVQKRRKDLLGHMLDGSFRGQPLSDLEIVQMVFVLLFGAVGTTASAIAGSLHYLATHPDAQDELRDRRPIPNIAIEEFVRWVSPVQGLGRTTTRDTQIRGCPLHQGERVFLLWGSANHDERIFDDPETVQLARRPNKHLGFGFGPHRCIGAHLAKLMLRVSLEETLARFSSFRLDDPSALEWAGGEGRTLRRLPLVVSSTDPAPLTTRDVIPPNSIHNQGGLHNAA